LINEEATIQAIIEECENIDGFLVQLHSRGVFVAARYKNLVRSINTYRELLQGRNLINRKIANCLFALQQEFDNQVLFYQQHHHRDEQRKIIENAHAEVSDLILAILSEN
jgi:hypothetical protein